MPETQTEKIVNSTLFVAIGRVAIVFCAGAMPIAGSMLWGIGQGQIALDKKVEVGQAKVDSKIESIQSALTTLLTGRYTVQDAQRDLQLRDLKIETLDSRIRELEHQVRATTLDVREQQQQDKGRGRNRNQ